MRLALDRRRFILGQRGPVGAQVTTVNRQGGGGGGGSGGEGGRLHARRVQPAARSLCPTRCPYVWLGFPLSVSQSGQCRGFERTRGAEGEREKQCLLLITKKETRRRKKEKESLSFRLLLTFGLDVGVATDTHGGRRAGGKNERWKNTKTMSTESGWLKSCKKQLWLWECADPGLSSQQTS